ncbi:MAG TPA: TadE family protein [Anaerolineaceae bacterium]|nr:TadE family protein [Anaerolineaceae bacterium]
MIRASISRIRHRGKPSQPAPKAQSFVEFAIFLPIFLMIFSGLVELGFFLNQYLNILDGAREAARYYSDGDPKKRDLTGADCSTTLDFYKQAACLVAKTIYPVRFDAGKDDVVISVIGVANHTRTYRWPSPPNDPAPYPETNGEWHLFGRGGACDPDTDDTCHPALTNAEIDAKLGSAPNTGIIVVEVFYNYHQVLSLPWITLFLKDPVKMHVYAIMPISAAEPTATPIP